MMSQPLRCQLCHCYIYFIDVFSPPTLTDAIILMPAADAASDIFFATRRHCDDISLSLMPLSPFRHHFQLFSSPILMPFFDAAPLMIRFHLRHAYY
jgi:hypothetical protein